MTIEGTEDGEQASYALTDLLPADADKDWPFSFRYFQDLQANVTIPADFEPSRVRVKARLQGQTSKTVEEFFDWNVKPG